MFRIAIVEDDNLYTLQLEEYIKKYQEESGVEFQIITFLMEKTW